MHNMFEGKNKHFSLLDKKPLCSFSGKLCKQRRLNGYAFCLRHILEDPSAPYKQCLFNTRTGHQCSNAVPLSRDTELCNNHVNMQNAGSGISPAKSKGGATTNGLPSHRKTAASKSLKGPASKQGTVGSLSVGTISNSSPSLMDDPYAFPSDPDPTKPRGTVDPAGLVSKSGRMCENAAPHSSMQGVLATAGLPFSNLVQSLIANASSTGLKTSIANCSSSNTVVSGARKKETVSSSIACNATGSSSTISSVAKLYPALAEKLEKPPKPPRIDTRTGLLGANTVGGILAGNGVGSNSSISSNSGGGSGGNSSNSRAAANRNSGRTMNRLQTKIAQNKIKDKLKKNKTNTARNLGINLKPGNTKTMVSVPYNPVIATVSDSAIAMKPYNAESKLAMSLSLTSSLGELSALPVSPSASLSQNYFQQALKHAASSASKVSTPGERAPECSSSNGVHSTSSTLTNWVNITNSKTAAAFSPESKSSSLNYTRRKESCVETAEQKPLPPVNFPSARLPESQPQSVVPVIGATTSNAQRIISQAASSAGQCVPISLSLTSPPLKLQQPQLLPYKAISELHSKVDMSMFGFPPTLPLGQLPPNVLAPMALAPQSVCSQSNPKSPPPYVLSQSCTTPSKPQHHSQSLQQSAIPPPVILTSPVPSVPTRVLSKAKLNNSKKAPPVASSVKSKKITCKGDHSAVVTCKSASGDCGKLVELGTSGILGTYSRQLNKYTNSEVVCVQPRKRVGDKLLVDTAMKKKLKRHSAVNIYRQHLQRMQHNRDIIPMGIDSSDSDSSGDEEIPWQREWLMSSSEDEYDNDEFGMDLASKIRKTNLGLLKAKLRRHFFQLHRCSSGSRRPKSNEVCDLQMLIHSARHDAEASGLATEEILTSSEKSCAKACEVGLIQRPCLCKCEDEEASDERTETEKKACTGTALPYTNNCLKHIMYNVDQQLFDYCTAKFSDNTQCCIPVFDIKHELPLCSEHAAKADNYQKNIDCKPKKPRKKTKPSALTRPPKKGKKKKNQRKNSKQKLKAAESSEAAETGTETEEQLIVTDEADSEVNVTVDCENKPEIGFIEPEKPSTTGSEDEDSFDDALNGDLEESFSPGTIDNNLELPLDNEQATQLLEEHDLNDVLNKLPVEAFDLFHTGKNGEFKEESEAFANVLAEVSKEMSTSSKRNKLGAINDPSHLSVVADGTCEDDLTKQIADQILNQNHLSPTGSIGDDLGQDNLNALASSLSANDLKSISQVLNPNFFNSIPTSIMESVGASLASPCSLAATTNLLHQSALLQPVTAVQGQVIQGQTLGQSHTQFPQVQGHGQIELPSALNYPLSVQSLTPQLMPGRTAGAMISNSSEITPLTLPMTCVSTSSNKAVTVTQGQRAPLPQPQPISFDVVNPPNVNIFATSSGSTLPSGSGSVHISHGQHHLTQQTLHHHPAPHQSHHLNHLPRQQHIQQQQQVHQIQSQQQHTQQQQIHHQQQHNQLHQNQHQLQTQQHSLPQLLPVDSILSSISLANNATPKSSVSNFSNTVSANSMITNPITLSPEQLASFALPLSLLDEKSSFHGGMQNGMPSLATGTSTNTLQSQAVPFPAGTVGLKLACPIQTFFPAGFLATANLTGVSPGQTQMLGTQAVAQQPLVAIATSVAQQLPQTQQSQQDC